MLNVVSSERLMTALRAIVQRRTTKTTCFSFWLMDEVRHIPVCLPQQMPIKLFLIAGVK